MNQAAEAPAVASTSSSPRRPFREGRDDLDRKLDIEHPDRMKLTREEYDNAVAIKEMVEGLPELDNLSDYMYAQFAIVCEDNYENILERCYALQEFRKEYKILDSLEQGCRLISEGVKLFPTQYVCYSFSKEEGVYVLMHDVEKFDPKLFTNSEMADDWIRTWYYIHMLFFPDLEAIRKGVVILVDCKDITFRRDRMKHMKLAFESLLAYYPHSGQCRMFNTGTIWNVIASLLRKILPPEVKDNFLVGYQYDGMSSTFLTPTVEEANLRVISRMQLALMRRYDNEKTFSLDEIVPN